MPEPPILSRIHIEGFKSIREADIELRPLNILIGANGAGKSNFLGVFKLLNAIVEKRLRDYSGSEGSDRLLHYGKKQTEEIALMLDFDAQVLFPDYKNSISQAVGYLCKLTPRGDILVFNNEDLYTVDSDSKRDHWFNANNNRETHVFALPNLGTHPTETIREIINPFFQTCRVYHFNDTTPEARIRQPSNLNDNEYLRANGANLPAFLYLLRERHADYYTRIVKVIQLAAPYFDDFRLRPNPLNPNTIRLEWREKASDDYFDAYDLSDGTLRFICLVTLLTQPSPPPVIIIDEPELGLHPYALNLLANLLRSAAAHTQVIVSTQSAAFVSHFDPEDILVIDREDNQSVFRRLKSDDLESWLEEYNLGELWEKNIFGGRPHR
jgi:predicted ATPase